MISVSSCSSLCRLKTQRFKKSITPRCCSSSLPDEAASARVVREASKTFEGQKCACSDVSESKVAGTDGLAKRSWNRRLAPWSVRRAW